MAFAGSPAFSVLGVVGVDGRQAEAALTSLTNSAEAMASAAEQMADTAEDAFRRFNDRARGARDTTISLRGAFEALASAVFVKTMESWSSSMFAATAKLQDFRRTLVGVTGSAGEAAKVLKEVSEYSDKTPLDTDKMKQAATSFASLKQPIVENLDLAAKLSFLFQVDLTNAAQSVAEANSGVVDSLQRLKEQFAFTADQAQRYGAVVVRGHIQVGRPGSETNDRLMAALRSYVADREKGLGGDLFGGDLGITGAFSNLRSGIFLLLSSLGDQVAPMVKKVSDGMRSMLDWVRALPGPIQSLIAHFSLLVAGIGALAGPLTVLFGFFRLFGLVQQFAGALATLAAGETAAAGATTLLTASFGPLMAAFAVGSVAIALYAASWEKVDKNVHEATKRLTEFHNESKGKLTAGGGKALTDPNLTVSDLSKSGLSTGEAVTIAREFARRAEKNSEGKYDDNRIQTAADELTAAKRRLDPYRNMAGNINEAGMTEQERGRYREAQAEVDAKQKAFDASRQHWLQPAATLTQFAAGNVLGDLKKAFQDLVDKASGKAPPREYHEISFEAERDAQQRSLNNPEMGRKRIEERLKSQVGEAEDSLRAERESQIRLRVRERGLDPAGEKALRESEEGKSILSGGRDDPEQWKAYIDLRKRYNDVRKEGLDVGQQERDNALEMATIERKDTYQQRIQAIEDERAAYSDAYRDRVISEEEFDSKIRDLSVRRAQEDQKQKDAQRDMNLDMAKLYGDDVKAAQIELDKKVRAWRQSGVDAVDVEKRKNAEILQARAEASVKEIQLEQKIADDKAAIRTRRASTQESVLQERRSRGEDVGEALRESRTAESEAQKSDVDARTARRRRALREQIKAETNPRKRREMEAELGNLDASAQAEKESIDQESGSRNRAEAREDVQRKREGEVGQQEVQVSRLGFRNEMLREKIERPGTNLDKVEKEMLSNLRQQYDLQVKILEEKERIAEEGKTEVEKQNLRNQLELDKLKLQGDSLQAARDVTAEIEKQNALNKQAQGQNSFTLGGSYSSYADIMAADKADSDSMRAKFFAKDKKDKKLASKLGFSLDARRNTTFVDANAAKAAGEEATAPPGARTGLEKTAARWAAINEAGKKADLKGRATLVVRVKTQDEQGNKVGDDVDAVVPLDKMVPQDTRNPLGGDGGSY